MKKEVMAEYEAERFLSKYLPIAKSELCKDIQQAKKCADRYGYPVVLKLISKQALHKTDIGGVEIVKEECELLSSYRKLMQVVHGKKIKLEGILVQEYVEGIDLIIGLINDKTFGHVLLFGLGGILVEVMKDVSFRKCPITIADAEEMINELKSKQVLFGVRGKKAVNLNLLKKTLVKVSKIPLKGKGKEISELDINPFRINDKVGKVVDARIVFG